MANLIVNISGTTLLNTNNIIFVDGLSLEKVKMKYNWLLNASVKDAIIGESGDLLVWYFGDWLCGEWVNGIWYSGTFHDGVWKNGNWYSYKLNKFDVLNGQLEVMDIANTYSNFKNGVWLNGTFHQGTFGFDSGETWTDYELYTGNTYPTFRTVSSIIAGSPIYTEKELATWMDGIFENGIVVDAIWNSGRFLFGHFKNSKWLNGTWYNGTFNGHTWHNGRWYNGDFILGYWLNGTFTRLDSTKESRFGNTTLTGLTTESEPICEWYNGTWLNGEFFSGYVVDSNNNVVASTMHNLCLWHDGIWKNGRWYGGHFINGTWYNGIWYNGLFGNVSRTNWIDPTYVYQPHDAFYWSGDTITPETGTTLSYTPNSANTYYEWQHYKQTYDCTILSTTGGTYVTGITLQHYFDMDADQNHTLSFITNNFTSSVYWSRNTGITNQDFDTDLSDWENPTSLWIWETGGAKLSGFFAPSMLYQDGLEKNKFIKFIISVFVDSDFTLNVGGNYYSTWSNGTNILTGYCYTSDSVVSFNFNYVSGPVPSNIKVHYIEIYDFQLAWPDDPGITPNNLINMEIISGSTTLTGYDINSITWLNNSLHIDFDSNLTSLDSSCQVNLEVLRPVSIPSNNGSAFTYWRFDDNIWIDTNSYGGQNVSFIKFMASGTTPFVFNVGDAIYIEQESGYTNESYQGFALVLETGYTSFYGGYYVRTNKQWGQSTPANPGRLLPYYDTMYYRLTDIDSETIMYHNVIFDFYNIINTATTLISGYQVKLNKEVIDDACTSGYFFDNGVSLPLKDLDYNGSWTYGSDRNSYLPNPYDDPDYPINGIIYSYGEIVNNTYYYGGTNNLWGLEDLYYYYPVAYGYNPDDYNVKYPNTAIYKLKVSVSQGFNSNVSKKLRISDLQIRAIYCDQSNLPTWKNGVWNRGTWFNGTWENGSFYSGMWMDGTWYNGFMGSKDDTDTDDTWLQTHKGWYN